MTRRDRAVLVVIMVLSAVVIGAAWLGWRWVR